MLEPASLAVINADVRTMDEDRPRAEAVLIVDGQVAVVGTTPEVLERANGEGLEVIDAGGRTVLPGFIDAHTHMELASYSMTHWLDAHTPPHTTLSEIAVAIMEFLEAHPGDEFLLVRSSFGMHAKVDERRLFTREELDRIAVDRPIAVASGLHVLSLNTPAMEALGIFGLEDSAERVIHRDADGVPSGVVTEVFDRMPFFSKEALRSALDQQVPVLATRFGVTTIGSIAWNPFDQEVFAEAIDAGLPIRLKSYLHIPRVLSKEEAIEARIDSRAGATEGGAAGLKIFVDGQHGDGIDAVFDDLKWTQAELTDFVRRASEVGSQVLMHSVSTTAIRMALEAIASTGEGNPLRHRIEHGADYIEAADVPAAASVGALMLVTPQFIVSAEGEVAGPGALLRTLADAGVLLVGGTDTTGTVPEGAAPLYNIACAMHRTGESAAESLTFDEAVALFTSNAAYAMFEERSRGSIVPGKLGDLVLLDRAVDELSESSEYFALGVAGTVFSGQLVFSANEADGR